MTELAKIIATLEDKIRRSKVSLLWIEKKQCRKKAISERFSRYNVETSFSQNEKETNVDREETLDFIR